MVYWHTRVEKLDEVNGIVRVCRNHNTMYYGAYIPIIILYTYYTHSGIRGQARA